MGAWIWQRLTPLLGRGVIAIDERIAPADGAPARATLSDCAAHVARAIDGAGARDAILVAHSGAGVIAPYVQKHTRAVRHIVFISANIPPEGGSALSGLPFAIRLMNAVAIRMNRKPIAARSHEKMMREHFLNASPEDVVELMLSQDIRPEPPCGAFERVRREGMPKVPGTFIKCLRDGTLSQEGLDRMIANYGGMETMEIDADHMVMLSRPRELADALNGIAERVAADAASRA
jgi:pimeloyl-ACP methyl ester carboxylesterase